MKRTIAAFAALALVGVASAQSSISGSQATGAAINSGVSMSNYFAGTSVPAFTGAYVHQSGIPKPSANNQLTAIAPPPSPKTCADTGVSVGGGGRGGSALLAFGTGAEEGCDLVRDLEIVDWVLKLPEGTTRSIALQRICDKKTIKTALTNAGQAKLCETTEQRQQRAEAILSDQPQVALSSDPLIRARQLGQ